VTLNKGVQNGHFQRLNSTDTGDLYWPYNTAVQWKVTAGHTDI